MACDTPISELVESAKCFNCLSEHQLQALVTYLVCQLEGGSIGTTQVLQGNGAPTDDPADTSLPYIYTDRETGVNYFWNTVTLAWE